MPPAVTATADNNVAIKYVDSNYDPIGTATFVTVTAEQKDALSTTDLTALNEYAAAQVSTGYMVSSSAVTAAYVDTIQVQVVKAATSKISFMVAGDATTSPKALTATDLNGGVFPLLTGEPQVDANSNTFYLPYTLDVTATQAANTNAVYGQPVKAYYTTTINQGPAPSATVDNGNTNYVD